LIYSIFCTSFEVWFFLHDEFEAHARVLILSHFDEEQTDVVHDLEAKVLVGARHLVQRHPVQLDRPLELAQARVDVAHVDFEAARVAENAIFRDRLVHVQRLLQQPRRLVLLRQVKQNLWKFDFEVRFYLKNA